MRMPSLRGLHVVLALAAGLAAAMSAAVPVAAVAPDLSPADAIRQAVVARVGGDASVTVRSIEPVALPKHFTSTWLSLRVKAAAGCPITTVLAALHPCASVTVTV